MKLNPEIEIELIFDDKEFIGQDSLFSDSTFKDIPTHDSIDCSGSCTVKVYNR